MALGEELLVDGAGGVPPERRRIGLVFQDWALFPHLNVAANVAFGLDRAQRRAARSLRGVDEALAMVGLEGFADAHAGHALRRAAAACRPGACAGPPAARTAAGRAVLQPGRRVALPVRAEVATLLRDLHLTAVFVTHDQEEAFLLGDEVAVMLHGRIAQQGVPRDLYELPASEAVAAFVGDANLLPGIASGGAATTAVGTVPLQSPASGRVAVLVRPEDLVVERGDRGVVTDLEYYGHDAVYRLATEEGLALRARVLARPALRPATGLPCATADRRRTPSPPATRPRCAPWRD